MQDNPHRYTLTFHWAAEPNFEVRFASFEECRRHVQRAVQRPARIYDSSNGKSGMLFPSGYCRWNRERRNDV